MAHIANMSHRAHMTHMTYRAPLRAAAGSPLWKRGAGGDSSWVAWVGGFKSPLTLFMKGGGHSQKRPKACSPSRAGSSRTEMALMIPIAPIRVATGSPLCKRGAGGDSSWLAWADGCKSLPTPLYERGEQIVDSPAKN